MTDLGPALLLAMYETAATIRRFEQRAIEQYRLGNIRGYLHPYLGEEAIAVGAIAALESDDYIVSTHRGHGHAIAKGHDPRRMMAELFGKETGYCHGRGGWIRDARADGRRQRRSRRRRSDARARPPRPRRCGAVARRMHDLPPRRPS